MTKGLVFIYDGDCPLCANGAAAIRIRREFGDLKIINARELSDEKLIKLIRENNLDLNEGAVFIYDNQIYFGAEALNIIAIMSEETGFINATIVKILKSKNLSAILYPALKAVRNLLLFLRSKKPIRPI